MCRNTKKVQGISPCCHDESKRGPLFVSREFNLSVQQNKRPPWPLSTGSGVWTHVYLWKKYPQQQSCHYLVVVSQPDEESVGATSGVNHLDQVQALPAKNKNNTFRF